MLEATLSAPLPGPRVRPRELLRRCNAAILTRKRALAHRHDDDAFWTARDETAALAQSARVRLAWFATVLHVHQATRRGRLHGRYFATLELQRAWLASAYVTWLGDYLSHQLGCHYGVRLGEVIDVT